MIEGLQGTCDEFAAYVHEAGKFDISGLLRFLEEADGLPAGWRPMRASMGRVSGKLAGPGAMPSPEEYEGACGRVRSAWMAVAEIWVALSQRGGSAHVARDAAHKTRGNLEKARASLAPSEQVAGYSLLLRNSGLPTDPGLEEAARQAGATIDAAIAAMADLEHELNRLLTSAALVEPARKHQQLLKIVEAHLHAGGFSSKKIAELVDDGLGGPEPWRRVSDRRRK